MKKIYNLYTEKGWLNVESIINKGYTFNFLIGPRGTGKTYGVLEYLVKKGKPFIYIRRTLKDIEMSLLPTTNPFNALNKDINKNIIAVSVNKNQLAFYDSVYNEETNKREPIGEVVALAFSLSTVAGIRGLSLEDYDYIYFDEFIPLAGSRKMKNEAEALFDFYETVNRNRELKGLPPVKLIASSNSNTLNNDIFRSLGLISIISKMIKNKDELYTNKEKDLLVANIIKSPISKKKRKTALYKLIGGSDYEKMAVSNEYVADDFTNVKSLNLKGFKPLFNVADLYVYINSDSDIYVSKHKKGTFKEYLDNPQGYKNMMKENYYLYYSYIENKIYYESYEIKIDFIEKAKL